MALVAVVTRAEEEEMPRLPDNLRLCRVQSNECLDVNGWQFKLESGNHYVPVGPAQLKSALQVVDANNFPEGCKFSGFTWEDVDGGLHMVPVITKGDEIVFTLWEKPEPDRAYIVNYQGKQYLI